MDTRILTARVRKSR